MVGGRFRSDYTSHWDTRGSSYSYPWWSLVVKIIQMSPRDVMTQNRQAQEDVLFEKKNQKTFGLTSSIAEIARDSIKKFFAFFFKKKRLPFFWRHHS